MSYLLTDTEFNAALQLNADYRYQHFKARVFHEIDTNPELRSEWLEIYQHHFGNTRMLDWSESAKTALSFAVEPYLDTSENIKDYIVTNEITYNAPVAITYYDESKYEGYTDGMDETLDKTP